MDRFRRAPVTSLILLVILAVFAVEFVTQALWDNRRLAAMGAILPGMMAYPGEWWRAFAAMFLHASALHWAANSWALFQLGGLYEMMFGSRRFAFTYFTTGILASIASSLFTTGPAVGASGAILGVLGAFIFSLKRSPLWRNEPWTKGLVSQLVFWAVVNIVLGFMVENIDNVAHITGFVTGLVIGLFPHRVPPPPPSNAVINVTPRSYGSE